MRIAGVVVFIASCADELPSRGEVGPELRVFAVRAEAPAMEPGDSTSLAIVTNVDDVSVAWTACQDPPGDDPLRCLDRGDKWWLQDGVSTSLFAPDVATTVGIVALACRGPILEGPVLFCDSEEETAVRRVVVTPTPDDVNPTIESISIGGVDVPPEVGLSFDACVDPCPAYRILVDASDDSAQTIAGAGRRESLLASFAAEVGSFASAFDDEAPFDGEWTPPPGEMSGRIWIVLHDDRGGVDVREVLVRSP
jgi:hypothetical protein